MYQPNPQSLRFHQSDAPYLLDLGPRGTGKSKELRADALLRCVCFPGFQALVLRRTMPELRTSHLGPMEIQREVKLLGGEFLSTISVAKFPNGSQIAFRHCETEQDILNFLSAQYGFIGFDELSTFTLRQFLNISAAARVTADAPYQAVVRATSNPLGPGAAWMKEWFVDKTVDLGEYPDYHPDDFQCIFSTLEGNPHLDAEEYKRRLKNLPEAVRRAWLHGEFVIEGQYFQEFRPTKEGSPWHVIDALPTVQGRPLLAQPWIQIYRAIDPGFKDACVCLWIASLPSGKAIVFKEFTAHKSTATEAAHVIKRMSEGMRIVETFIDPSAFATSSHTGLAIADYYEQAGIPLTASRNDRTACGFAISEWLGTLVGGEPKLQILAPQPDGLGCPMLIKTLPQMQTDPTYPGKLADHPQDHWTIGLGYFCQGAIAPSRPGAHATPRKWMQAKSRHRGA